MATVQAFGRPSAKPAQQEVVRLAALEELDLLETPRDEGFERLVRLIKEIFAVEIGIVSLIDAHRQWYKACSGMGVDEVPRQDTFCRFVLDDEAPIIVQDATKDSRFAQNSAVTGEAHIRFYAGVPLVTRQGHIVGTVCAIDRRPRSFDERDLSILKELAGAAMDRIELVQHATTDSLTGALTRRAFKEEADRLIALAVRHRQDLSCLVLDIDHFKAVNDTFGHACGDQVLQRVASACQSEIRRGDPFGRLGGEEFAVLLPSVDSDTALAAAQRLRAAISSQSVMTSSRPVNTTASIGVSSLSAAGENIETLLAQADAAMYRAKQTGRNRCIAWHALGVDGSTPRRRVLKAGSIIFDNRRSVIECTIKTLGEEGAGLTVSNSIDIPTEFILAIRGDAFEINCRVIARDRQHLELSFG
ncbi:sensor domain-containing diguanylate cyclase [Rhizobium paranaense]|uniref:sensor domain-containing diguanylate cyclase n=1 Tax=Rhizobium paranaense TaxID=1650438 RepID=UPI001613A52E|nr:sensor domain-containing diguanylate cyclase [Rhizobium paranaense]